MVVYGPCFFPRKSRPVAAQETGRGGGWWCEGPGGGRGLHLKPASCSSVPLCPWAPCFLLVGEVEAGHLGGPPAGPGPLAFTVPPPHCEGRTHPGL